MSLVRLYAVKLLNPENPTLKHHCNCICNSRIGFRSRDFKGQMVLFACVRYRSIIATTLQYYTLRTVVSQF